MNHEAGLQVTEGAAGAGVAGGFSVGGGSCPAPPAAGPGPWGPLLVLGTGQTPRPSARAPASQSVSVKMMSLLKIRRILELGVLCPCSFGGLLRGVPSSVPGGAELSGNFPEVPGPGWAGPGMQLSKWVSLLLGSGRGSVVHVVTYHAAERGEAYHWFLEQNF